MTVAAHTMADQSRATINLRPSTGFRSRPEANNVLLTVLEERMLVLPTASHDESYIRVHPQFRAIFTSNPQDYAGIHGAQGALSDRLITIDLDFYDLPTEAMIVAAAAGGDLETATRVVRMVQAYRESGSYAQTPTMRAALMIARVIAHPRAPGRTFSVA